MLVRWYQEEGRPDVYFSTPADVSMKREMDINYNNKNIGKGLGLVVQEVDMKKSQFCFTARKPAGPYCNVLRCGQDSSKSSPATNGTQGRT